MNSTTTLPQPDGSASLASARAWFAANGLSRPKERRMLGGVSAGLARRYEVDRLVMRILMIAGVLILSPLVYVGLWVLMPSDA
jgi:phage shock protein PspC (stress-responsive transcriptional regulator)